MRAPAIIFSLFAVLLAGCERPEKTPAAIAVPKPAVVKNQNTTSLLESELKGARVLVFSKTKGWRHESIPAGIAAFQKMATDHFFSVVATEDANYFNDAELSKFNVIVFLNTTQDVLDENQQIAMERFIQAGGGFVGVHSAADTEWEGDWYWYRKLVGAVFKGHPNEPSNVQMARVDIKDPAFFKNEKLPSSIELADEWYDYRDFYAFNKVLLTVDEKTYYGAEQGDYHPITWYHDFDGGRSFYTGLGHTIEAYSNPYFLSILLDGLKYAVGGKPVLDYSKARPENNRFTKKTLIADLNEPINVSFFTNGDALISERNGTVKLVDYKSGDSRDVGKIEVSYQNFLELGLLGLAIDPSFDRNHFIYAAFNVEKNDGALFQRLARFNWSNDKIDETTQHVLLEYPINKNCCHTGGDLQFGKNGELFMSTGDNTNPHDQNGYGPIDFRPDAEKNDALRSAGNTQDFRGKVLRIKPLEAGGYEVPKGNLFTDPKDGRPEIYVMGTRNPYKITYDKNTSTLFYGDVGPDAGEDSKTQGPRGYDEINRVTQAGNFGWPLFIANNYAFVNYDFITHQSEKMFNPLAPVNNSPRNTGLKQLPPAQRPLLWYPYGLSAEFPELGKGGRTAIVADVYQANDYPLSEQRYPSYYNGKLFIVDFMRNWIKAVSFDEFGRIIKIDPFAPNIAYTLPIDARFAPDGTLYVLEYGAAWFKGNSDARLSRIEYAGAGNRPPLPKITIEKTLGGVPFSTAVNANQSFDLDGDKLTYKWLLSLKNTKEKMEIGSGVQLQLNIPDAGDYVLNLVASDVAGATATAEVGVQAGNEPAEINITVDGNKTFYWPNTKTLKYSVLINDKEDGVVTDNLTNVTIDFFKQTNQQAPVEGHQVADNTTIAKELIKVNNCMSCHNLDLKLVGPAFKDVAKHYKEDKNGLTHLVDKIMKGGNGVWGELNMPAFATLTEADRIALATYVLSLADVKDSLPLQGELAFPSSVQMQKSFDSTEVPTESFQDKYEFNVEYKDKGSAGIAAITATKNIIFIPARFFLAKEIKQEFLNKLITTDKFANHDTLRIPATGNWLTIHLGAFDLTGITSLQVGSWVVKQNAVWQFELRLGSDTGTVLASGDNPAALLDTYSRSKLKLKSDGGLQDVYLAIKSVEKSDSQLQLLDVSFNK